MEFNLALSRHQLREKETLDWEKFLYNADLKYIPAKYEAKKKIMDFIDRAIFLTWNIQTSPLCPTKLIHFSQHTAHFYGSVLLFFTVLD